MTTPLISFYKVVPDGLAPIRATRSAAGQLPVRGFRYCEAVTSASAFGWYVFPPIDFRLMWDGTDVIFSYGNHDDWFPLHAAVQYPSFRGYFDQFAPDYIKGFSPTWIALTENPGIVQIWSGCFAKTRTNWSLWIKSPANITKSHGYEMLEGVVENDRWFGPLFTNIRRLRSGSPLAFHHYHPLMQVVPVHRASYDDGLLNSYRVLEIKDMTSREWRGYYNSALNKQGIGSYAVAVRKRRALEQSRRRTHNDPHPSALAAGNAHD